MSESTAKLSSKTEASFYDADAFEMHIQPSLYAAREGTRSRTTNKSNTWLDKKQIYHRGAGEAYWNFLAAVVTSIIKEMGQT